jgi:hypothetical protein
MPSKSAFGPILCIAVSHMFCGCAQKLIQPKETYTADGRKGYAINCGGIAGASVGTALSLAGGGQGAVANYDATAPPNWAVCFQRAGDLCGTRGYDVLERSPNGAMLIQCKGQ